MTDIRDIEKAEKLGRSRARKFAVQGVIFAGWQGFYFGGAMADQVRTVDSVKIGAWLVWVLVLLALLATGGGFMRSRSVRALLNDELTRANRTLAYVAGFWGAMAAGIGCYLVNLFEPVSTRQAIHAIVSIAIAAALITFALRERRIAGFG
ncbi:MAG TPA: hypothetical protein VK472_02310 [Allosphingosinicella sp.]|nr:hypothetical protein [Allosphingosinicella sp.]